MKSDEQDDLWELLGRARSPKISPFFSRNVLREIRVTRQERTHFLARLRHSWRLTIPAGAVAALILFSSGILRQPAPVEPNPLIGQIVSNPDYEVINHLDELLASEENAIWLEPSTD